jgi:hypothetical protein
MLIIKLAGQIILETLSYFVAKAYIVLLIVMQLTAPVQFNFAQYLML